MSLTRNVLKWRQNVLSSVKKLLFSTAANDCSSVSSLISKWENIFKENDISEASLSIQHIMSHMLKLTSINDLSSVSSQILSKQQIDELDRFCQCRLAKMPVQYIIGEWDFCDFTVKLRPPVFIPRPETEQLVQLVVNRAKELNLSNVKFLEIGCGSGVISLALLKSLPLAKCVAIDRCKFACDLTLQNANMNNVNDRLEVRQGKLTSKGISSFDSTEKFDLVVSNPPYVPLYQLRDLDPEIILYEDLKALDGGLDGLSTIKNILNLAPNLLKAKGLLFLEVDPNHPTLIKKYLAQSNVKVKFLQTYQDFMKTDRFVELIHD